MTYQEKLQSVSTLIDNFNKEINPAGATTVNGINYINPEFFVQNIKFLGATDEEKLNGLSYEDILECLPSLTTPGNPCIKPRILCKEIAKIFRGKDESKVTASETDINKKVNNMSLRQLIESFDPEDLESKVAKRLASISRGEAFLVYSSPGNIDADVSAKLLSEIKQGYPGRKTVIANNTPKAVYKLGDAPDNFVDENPLYPGRMLRPDGTCDQTGRSWEGVPLEIKQLIHLAIKDMNLTFDMAHNLIDMAVAPDAMDKIRKRYHNAVLQFEELKKRNSLPSLIVFLSRTGPPRSSIKDGKKINWH